MMTLPRWGGRLILAAAVGTLLTGEAHAQFNPFSPPNQNPFNQRPNQFNAFSAHRNAMPQSINPWGNSVFGLPLYSTPSFLGYLPNGTPIIDPWAGQSVLPPILTAQSAFAYQYGLLNAASIWNPALAPYWGASAGWNLGFNGGFNGGFGGQFGANFGAFANTGIQPGAFGFGAQALAAANLGIQPGLTFGPITQREPGRFTRLGPDLAVNRVTGTVLQPYSGVAYTNEGPFFRLPGSGTFSPFGAYVPGTGLYVNPFSGVAYNPQTGLILR